MKNSSYFGCEVTFFWDTRYKVKQDVIKACNEVKDDTRTKMEEIKKALVATVTVDKFNEAQIKTKT